MKGMYKKKHSMQTQYKRLKLGYAFGSLLIRFYEQIISGVWAISLLIPFDRYIMFKLGGDYQSIYDLDIKKYFIYFILCTMFFILSAASIPIFKKFIMQFELYKLVKEKRITVMQMGRIRRILSKGLIYKTIFSRDGFYQFFLSSFFCLGIIAAYFGIESIIDGLISSYAGTNLQNNGRFTIGSIYIFMFLLILMFESILDSSFSKKITKRDSLNRKDENNKYVLRLIIRLFSGTSLADEISDTIVNDVIHDIYEILDIQEPYFIYTRKYKKNNPNSKRGMKKTISLKKAITNKSKQSIQSIRKDIIPSKKRNIKTKTKSKLKKIIKLSK